MATSDPIRVGWMREGHHHQNLYPVDFLFCTPKLTGKMGNMLHAGPSNPTHIRGRDLRVVRLQGLSIRAAFTPTSAALQLALQPHPAERFV